MPTLGGRLAKDGRVERGSAEVAVEAEGDEVCWDWRRTRTTSRGVTIWDLLLDRRNSDEWERLAT